MSIKRVAELLGKLYEPENEWLHPYLIQWSDESAEYAKTQADTSFFSEKGLRVEYVMTRYAAHLYHHVKIPKLLRHPDPVIAENYKKATELFHRENSLDTFLDEFGCISQEGVHFTDEEWDFIVAFLQGEKKKLSYKITKNDDNEFVISISNRDHENMHLEDADFMQLTSDAKNTVYLCSPELTKPQIQRIMRAYGGK